jgi:hypothetical protein
MSSRDACTGVQVTVMRGRAAIQALEGLGQEASVLMSGSSEFSGAHRDLMDGLADVPRVGALLEGSALSLPYVVVDAAGGRSSRSVGICVTCCWVM